MLSAGHGGRLPVRRNPGSADSRFGGLPVRRTPGSPDSRFAGLLVRMSCGRPCLLWQIGGTRSPRNQESAELGLRGTGSPPNRESAEPGPRNRDSVEQGLYRQFQTLTVRPIGMVCHPNPFQNSM